MDKSIQTSFHCICSSNPVVEPHCFKPCFILTVIGTFADQIIEMPFHFQCFDTFKYKSDSNPVSLSLFLVLLQIKLIKIPFIFTVLGDFIGQIDSNVNLMLIVSIVDTFSDQIHSNLISLCLFLILLQMKLIKSPLIFMVLGTFTSQIGAKQTFILILLATFHDQSVSALFRFHCYWYFN